MRTVRALYLLPAASFGGAERQAAQSIGLLPGLGVEVVPMVGPGRRIVEFLEDAGVERCLFREDLPDDPKAPRGSLARARLVGHYVRSYFRVAEALALEARRQRAEVVLASRPFAWVVGGMVGARLSLPVVWRAGTHFEHWVQPPLLRNFSRVWRPCAVVYTSHAVLRSLSPVVRATAFVVHNGVDLRRFSPPTPEVVAARRTELGLPPGAPTVGLVGRIAPEKGTETFLALCRGLRQRAPGVQVVVAGDSGWRRWLDERLAAERLDGSVRLLGFVREIERVYAASDVVVSTSAAEGCPNAVLEAMAMGRAVVATRVGGTSEILRTGVDGVLVEPDDVTGFAEQVASLLAAPARRGALGESAAAHVAAHFALERQVAQLASILRAAAGHGSLDEVEARPHGAAADGGRGRGASSSAAAVTSGAAVEEAREGRAR